MRACSQLTKQRDAQKDKSEKAKLTADIVAKLRSMTKQHEELKEMHKANVSNTSKRVRPSLLCMLRSFSSARLGLARFDSRFCALDACCRLG
jgi:geranylgeranyl pyrophosphate synthase